MENNFKQLLESAKLLMQSHDNRIEATQKVLKDTQYPLEDRWALFEIMERILPVKHWDCPEGEYDLFDTNRSATVLYLDRLETLEGAYEDIEDEWYQDIRATYPDLNAWKEKVLQSGFRGFVYDW